MMDISSEDKIKIKKTILSRMLMTAVFLIALFFGTAGSWFYWQAWIFWAIFIFSAAVGLYGLYRHMPDLLLRRMRFKEKRVQQRWIIYSSYPLFLAVMLLPGLDFRFGWSHIPVWLVIAGDGLYLLGYCLFIWVLKTNRYAGRTVETESEQKVIQNGPYALVRHPMYIASILTVCAAPLALGSIPVILAGVLVIPFIILRILDEEKTLRQELPGYTEYCQKVRYRLLPGIW